MKDPPDNAWKDFNPDIRDASFINGLNMNIDIVSVSAGVSAGALRFDGKSFENYSSDLPSSYVKSVINSKDNLIYVASDLGIGICKRLDLTITILILSMV